MDYITVREAAEKWSLAERTVQQLCRDGRIEGGRKFGGTWAIPAQAERPTDPRRDRGRGAARPVRPAVGERPFPLPNLMPLMSTPFVPGGCRAAIAAMEDGPRKDMAWAEYDYFSGRAEGAIQKARPYLTSPDLGLKLSACWLSGYASLATGQIQEARRALEEVRRSLAAGAEAAPELRAAGAFVAAGAAVLLHLPLPEGLPPVRDFLPLLPTGLRAFALYVQAHYLYLRGEYERSAGLVDATLSMGAERYPISALYLHLAAVMDYMSLRQSDRAQEHLNAALALARPDGLIEGLGEHHGLLGGMLESVLKRDWPEGFRQVIEITYRFSWGWRRIHNPDTGHDVADNLTTTEFVIAMLAAREWTNQEIGAHMGISPNTVKHHLAQAMKKLGVEHRKGLRRYMLL